MGAYEKAVDLLARREHTEKELYEKLSLKGFSPDEIRTALETLKSEGYLSESRYAEVFVSSRLRKTAEGKSLLIRRLMQKGVERSTASSAVDSAWEREEYVPSLEREWTRFLKKSGMETAEAKLRAKGFTGQEIRDVKERWREDTQE